MKALLRPAYHWWIEQKDRRKYTPLYTALHGNVDIETHLREAFGWIERAQDSGSDRGVAYGTQLGSGFRPSYPETTGYIAQTMVRAADRNPEYLRRAIEMGDWEIHEQMDSGAVMGGMVTALPKKPAIFNTGQVLLGWSALLRATGEDRFRQAGKRAADWMVEMQEPNGNWIRGNSAHASGTSTLYNVKAAWGLLEYGLAAKTQVHVDAALKNADFALSRQNANGWYRDNCLTDPARPLLHTIAYTMQGLLEIGLLMNEPKYIDSAEACAEGLRSIVAEDGFLPGRIDAEWRGAVDWCCLTGSAQTSICWSKLYRRTGRAEYRDAAKTVNRYLMRRHDISSPDPSIRGGLAGSWPVSGDYGKYQILNWAVKFFIDALLEEQRS